MRSSAPALFWRASLCVVRTLLIYSVACVPAALYGQQASPAPDASVPQAQGASPAPAALVPANSFDAAMAQYRDDDFSGAALSFNRLAQSGGPDAAKAMAWIARCDLKLGLIHEAELAAQNAVRLSPGLGTAHSALGEVYFRQGRFTEAETEFLTPLKTGVADPRAYYGEAMVSISASNHKHGKHLIDKAHMIDPEDPDIREAWRSTLPRSERLALAKPAPQPARADASAKDGGLVIPPPTERRCRLVTKVTSTEAPLERLMLDANLFRGFGLLV